eukprot:CAMPEP_0198148190 /NCGR_PEP_ID=MMETSP1443-20131203/40353_1 /TAXON_ID=186043 /ORGANISM="Entomoneis sp., Strain CCMP2396" /LENGTH=94 /DNA_ID=CAMNT_0043812817 /DNA_START=17 /DNA_END=297 /DNA_ORIENTATION=+
MKIHSYLFLSLLFSMVSKTISTQCEHVDIAYIFDPTISASDWVLIKAEVYMDLPEALDEEKVEFGLRRGLRESESRGLQCYDFYEQQCYTDPNG